LGDGLDTILSNVQAHTNNFSPLLSGISLNSSRRDHPFYPYGSALEDEDYRDKFQ
jgi:hypothetical protein